MSLTPAGRQALEASHRTFLTIEAEMTGGLDEREREQLEGSRSRAGGGSAEA